VLRGSLICNVELEKFRFLWLGLESTPLNGGTHTRTTPEK
jgi:hypothetical protein